MVQQAQKWTEKESMARATTKRQYGKQSKKTKAETLFAQLPQTPLRKTKSTVEVDEEVSCLTSQLHEIHLGKREKETDVVKCEEEEGEIAEERRGAEQGKEEEDKTVPLHSTEIATQDASIPDEHETLQPVNSQDEEHHVQLASPTPEVEPEPAQVPTVEEHVQVQVLEEASSKVSTEPPLRVLTWADVCPPGDTITKIAEASYAEVYRVANERGVSIIKVIRLQSPIKAQTKAQVKSGLVDEEPHCEDDLDGELRISEWLADIPGFVVYKERYVVQGRTTRQLLETHQAFYKKAKKEDPGRAQYYPSPSRYLDDTRFMVVELGDAGVALEDWPLVNEGQLWDIFLLEVIALARAEELAMFEHRDLHEGNICIKQVRPPRPKPPKAAGFFGHSGLEITILDYGLSRAEDLTVDDAVPVAFDLEKDLGLFTSTHAGQCKVYRQMRSFLLRADRTCLPPEAHDTPYARGIDGPIDWRVFAPYTNVLWLAYLYEYVTSHFEGPKRELTRFKKETAEMWAHLNPEAPEEVSCFGCAADVVCFAFESGWVREDQLQGVSDTYLEREESIVRCRGGDARETPMKRLRRGNV